MVMVSGARRTFCGSFFGLGYGDGDDGGRMMCAYPGTFTIGAEW